VDGRLLSYNQEDYVLSGLSKMKNLSQAQNLYDQEREKITLLEIAIPPNPSPNIFLRQIEFRPES